MSQCQITKLRPTAVIDMSVLREICEQEPNLRQAAWDCLGDRYQCVFPFALVEEAFCQWVAADCSPLKEGIAGEVAHRPQLWMEDVHNIVSGELLDQRLPEKLPGCSPQVRDQILALKKGDAGALAWLAMRRAEAEAIECGRRELKKEFLCRLAEEDRHLDTEGDLFRKIVVPFFRDLTSAANDQMPLVDRCLSERLKERRPGLAEKYDEAFSELLSGRWTQFYLTAGLLQVRFAYVAAPLTIVEGPRFGPTGSFIKISLNDPRDEEYIISALLCQRLLTQDLGMARIMAAFEDGGFWSGKTVYLPKGQWLHDPDRLFL